MMCISVEDQYQYNRESEGWVTTSPTKKNWRVLYMQGESFDPATLLEKNLQPAPPNIHQD